MFWFHAFLSPEARRTRRGSTTAAPRLRFVAFGFTHILSAGRAAVAQLGRWASRERASICDALSIGRRSPSLRWLLSLPSLSRPCRLSRRWSRGISLRRSCGCEFAPFHQSLGGVRTGYLKADVGRVGRNESDVSALCAEHADFTELGDVAFPLRAMSCFHGFNMCEAASHCNNYFQKSFAGGFRRESPTTGCS